MVDLWLLQMVMSGTGDCSEELPMELPPCPLCEKGRLLPFSHDDVAYGMWVCTMPDCSYVIGRSQTAQTFYKGTATMQDKEKNGKKWVEFQF